MLQFTDIQAAAARLKGVAHRTPILTSMTLNRKLGCEVFMKAENFQRMGAFKFRGGYNAINALTDAERARGVLAFSSGIHAQAVALAAQLHRCSEGGAAEDRDVRRGARGRQRCAAVAAQRTYRFH